jgi:hypothetical protein
VTEPVGVKNHATESLLTSCSLMVSGEAFAEAAEGFGIKHSRLPHEKRSLPRRLSRRWPPDLLTAATFTRLSRRNVKGARARGLMMAERVDGLRRANRLDEAYLCDRLQHLGGRRTNSTATRTRRRRAARWNCTRCSARTSSRPWRGWG